MPRMTHKEKLTRDLAKRLKAVRISAGYGTTNAFAAAIGIAGPAYRKYERAEALPMLDTFATICSVTGFSADWLLNGQGPPRQEPPPADDTADA